MRGHLFLIDCGEGTQMAMRKSKVKFSRIKHIFISHLHGDHVYGLVGLISTFCLLGRETPLTVYGPKGVKELVLFQLKLSGAYTTFPLRFRESVEKNTPILFIWSLGDLCGQFVQARAAGGNFCRPSWFCAYCSRFDFPCDHLWNDRFVMDLLDQKT